MRVFFTGVSCVGKTTIGEALAELLGMKFFDLDHEIETFFGTTIERLQTKYVTMYSYREKAAKALVHLLKLPESQDSVIALPPSGLMGGYLRVLKKTNGTIIALHDKPENILERIRFYDIDSKPIETHLSDREKNLYCRQIKNDINYFRKSYERAHLQIDISGLNVSQSAIKVVEVLKQ